MIDSNETPLYLVLLHMTSSPGTELVGDDCYHPSLPPSSQEKNAYNSHLNFTHQTDVRFVRAARVQRWKRTGQRECEQRAVYHSCWLFLQRQPSTGKLDSHHEDSCKRCAGHLPNVLIR